MGCQRICIIEPQTKDINYTKRHKNKEIIVYCQIITKHNPHNWSLFHRKDEIHYKVKKAKTGIFLQIHCALNYLITHLVIHHFGALLVSLLALHQIVTLIKAAMTTRKKSEVLYS